MSGVYLYLFFVVLGHGIPTTTGVETAVVTVAMTGVAAAVEVEGVGTTGTTGVAEDGGDRSMYGWFSYFHFLRNFSHSGTKLHWK